MKTHHSYQVIRGLPPVFNEFQRCVADNTYFLLEQTAIVEVAYVLMGHLALVDVMNGHVLDHHRLLV